MSENGSKGDNGRRKGAPPRFQPPRLFLILLMACAVVYLIVIVGRNPMGANITADRSAFDNDLRAGRVSAVQVSDTGARVKLRPGVTSAAGENVQAYQFNIIEGQADALTAQIQKYNDEHPDKLVGYSTSGPSMLWRLLLGAAPIIILFIVLYFLFFRSLSRSGGGGVLSFGKSRARLSAKGQVKVTFDDVAGVEEAKAEVQEIIEFLKNPKKFQRLGARIPRGILLVGAPGTGKTLLAKAIAGEADVPFFSISGSDFVEMFVGVGASRVRDLFRQAKENSPCIIFLDEIDAVGRRRGPNFTGGGHDEREQTLNAILVEMDGFESDENVVVIAATNRPDVLDPALRRPGRFDREVSVDMPDVRGREEILKVHARKVKMAPGVDLGVLARGTPSFSGADLEAIINEAAILASMKGKEAIDLSDLEESRDKVRWGRQRRSMVMSVEDKRITAFHESGHAVATKVMPEVEPLHKVTIVPRGMALGSTMHLPEKDRYHVQLKQLMGEITALLAGRVAEEMFCTDISSGARDDIRRATGLARLMVREWGMSNELGPIFYGDEESQYGFETVMTKPYSESTAVEIDKAVDKILNGCFERARKILGEHRENVRRVAEALLEKESLEAEDVDKIMSETAAQAAATGAETVNQAKTDSQA